MDVYVVIYEIGYDTTCVEGVFSTKEKANEFIIKLLGDKVHKWTLTNKIDGLPAYCYAGDSISIEKFVLDSFIRKE